MVDEDGIKRRLAATEKAMGLPEGELVRWYRHDYEILAEMPPERVKLLLKDYRDNRGLYLEAGIDVQRRRIRADRGVNSQ